MAGCSKKQYAIMMSAGPEGKKLASEMGGMEQDKFNEAFAELLNSDSYKPAEGEAKYSKEEDEDYREFDETNDDDFGFDEEGEDDGILTTGLVREELLKLKGKNSNISKDELEHLTYMVEDALEREQLETGEKYTDISQLDLGGLIDSSTDEIHELGQKLLGLDSENEGNQGETKKYHFEQSMAGDEPEDLSIQDINYMIDRNMEGRRTESNIRDFLRGAGLKNEADLNEIMNNLDVETDYMSGEIFYTGDHAYKITNISGDDIRYIDEKGTPHTANINEFKKMVELENLDTHGITEEEAKGLGLDSNNWNEVSGSQSNIKEPSNYEELTNAIESKIVNHRLSPEDAERLTQQYFTLNNAHKLTKEQSEEIEGWLGRLQGEVSNAKMNEFLKSWSGNKNNSQPQSSKYKVGDKVITKDGGPGTIRKIRDNGVFEVDFDNGDTGEYDENDFYQSKYKSEDYEDARYYPVTEEDRKAAGPKYLGRYHSIYDAAGLDDKDPAAWKKERDMFKYVGDSNTGASIVQGPDGYFSGNPRINSMSFKTMEQARDYLDRKNPEEHKYGVYFKPGDEREYVYRDKDDKYDLDAPDAYRIAREAAKANQEDKEFKYIHENADTALNNFESNPDRNLSNTNYFLQNILNTIRYPEKNVSENTKTRLKTYLDRIENVQEKRFEQGQNLSNKDIEIYGKLYAIRKLLDKKGK